MEPTGMKDLFDMGFTKTSMESNPFYNRKVCVTGDFGMARTEVKKKIEAMRALKVDNKLTRDTHYILIGANPDNDVIKRYKLNKHDGWNAKCLTERDFIDILNGRYEDYITDTKLSKKIKVTLEHYNFDVPVINDEELSSRVSSPIILDESTNPISQKEIFICGDLSGNINMFSQIIGNLGGYANRMYFDDTQIILLSDKTYAKLLQGETDEYLKNIEYQYNNSNSPAFNIQFTCEKIFIKWVEARLNFIAKNNGIELESDPTYILLKKYKESKSN